MKDKGIKVKLSGNNKDGYVLSVSNKKDSFMWDVALTIDELKEIHNSLNKKFK